MHSRFVVKSAILFMISLLLLGCSPQHIVKGARPPAGPYFIAGAGVGATLGSSLAAVFNPSAAGPGLWTGALLGAAIGSYYDGPGLLLAMQQAGITVFELGDVLEIVIPADYLFEGSDTEIKVSAYQMLSSITRLLQEYNSPQRITITGHTDNVGDELSRIELSTMQAQAVTTYLWMNGIDLEIMDFYGMSDTEDVGDFRTSIGAAYNRRIEILLWRNSPPTPINLFRMGAHEDKE